ncbi:MAG: hypothetical protein ACF8XB_05675 [Planctomycetota bacterium JB042]
MSRSRLGFVPFAALLASGPPAGAQHDPPPAPETEEYVEARVEAVVEFLGNAENDPDLQYASSPFLVSYLRAHGAEGLSDASRAATERFVKGALEGLRGPSSEAARLRGGIAIRLAPWFADAEVRSLLHEALELNFDQVAWRPEFFATLRQVGLAETLDHFRAVVDEFAALEPEELRTAPFPYPIREAFRCLAVFGGDEEADRLRPYLRPGVPAAIRAAALSALGEIDGPRAHELLVDFAEASESEADGETEASWVLQATGEALVAHDDARGARLLLDLARGSGGPRALAALRRAAGRPLPEIDDAAEWVERLGDGSVRAARRAAIAEGGYAIGDLATAEERAALLAAAADDDPFRRRAAWEEVVALLGDDPSHGRFWTYRAERRGVEVDIVHRPGQPIEDDEAAALREVQAEMVERARRRMAD